jgi:hypothetical protein
MRSLVFQTILYLQYESTVTVSEAAIQVKMNYIKQQNLYPYSHMGY